ncbi:hypothetical protein BGAL_0082g00350 [Botrytis galanthina]|uniref:Uncharacterized protein n=1 Tax=Botrytis galanthina TaxID=278940 RepID=A0A4S8R7T1_9HELO|nr:hypothetical protein BGAL_0082g00350 [Botrytis galanthina]
MNGNYSNRSRSNEYHSNRMSSSRNPSNGNRSNRNSLNGNSSNENIANGNYSYGNISNGNLLNGNLWNGNYSNRNISNEILLDGDLSNGNLSNGDLSNGNLSNGLSHSSAPQTDWKNLFHIKTNWLEKCQAELHDSQLKFLQVQEQCQKLQESYKELRMAWQNLWVEQEKDWQLRAETARAFQEFQTVYEEERKQRLSTEQARQSFDNTLQRGLLLLNGTAQNTARDSNPFGFQLGRDPFENLAQLATPNQSPPLQCTLNPVAPVFSSPLDHTRAHSADSAYYSPSSQEARNGNEPVMLNESSIANSSNASSISSPPTPPNPSPTQFRIPRIRSEFPRRRYSDSYLTDMRAGRAFTPE